MHPQPDSGLILGIGNVLLGDEGIGPAVIAGLGKETLPHGWHLLDGGTGGFLLLECFRTFPRLILIDACLDNQPEGTITIRHPRFAADYPSSLSAHDIGLADLVRTAQLLGDQPAVHLITISVKESNLISGELSPAIRAVIPDVIREVINLIAEEVVIS